MSLVAKFARFWYDFVVGDDWTIAAGVLVALAVSAWLAQRALNAWWLLPPAVVVVLGVSIWREIRAAHLGA